MMELFEILGGTLMLILACGWILNSGDRQVFYRPEPKTDPPELQGWH